MANSRFLLLVLSVISVVLSPTALMATDSVVVSRVSDARAVETVIPPEEPVSAKAPAAGVSPVATSVTAPVVAPVVYNYVVTNQVGSVDEYVNSHANLSYAAIYKYNKMVYGHNTANLLGSLADLMVGDDITITEGGVVGNYRVAAVALYEKTADGYLNHDPGLMTRIANTAMGHSVALFTCAGRSLGGGDATHRLVVYADRV